MLKDNVVAITGGAGLIGTAFAKAIIKSRGKVIIGDGPYKETIRLKSIN